MRNWFSSSKENEPAKHKTYASKDDLSDIACFQSGAYEVKMSKDYYIRSVSDIKEEILTRTVANRQAMVVAAARYEVEIEKELGKWIEQNFDKQRIRLFINVDKHELVDADALMNIKVIDNGSTYRKNDMHFVVSMPNGFYENGRTCSKWIEFKDSEVSSSEWLRWLSSVLTCRIEAFGYIIEKKSIYGDAFECTINWTDDAFWEACSKFDTDSQIDAYKSGVPVEDILA